jgi:capsular exopolysaccharide synthesis family protein
MDSNLITLRDPRNPAAEAYRALRMNLAFTSLDQALSMFVVSSPAASDMDSAVAANVAVVMAQAGQRVILVDADLRRPSLHTLFDLSQEPGITTMLLGQGDGVDLPLINTEVPGLSLLPSGPQPPNPADILGSNRMHMLLARLKELSDIVILQAPPVTVAVDASVLAVQTDGLLLAVRAGHTRRDRVDQAKSILERYRVRLLGAVMTDAPDRGLLTGY